MPRCCFGRLRAQSFLLLAVDQTLAHQEAVDQPMARLAVLVAPLKEAERLEEEDRWVAEDQLVVEGHPVVEGRPVVEVQQAVEDPSWEVVGTCPCQHPASSVALVLLKMLTLDHQACSSMTCPRAEVAYSMAVGAGCWVADSSSLAESG